MLNSIVIIIGEQKSNHGWTPLHLACYFGHESIVELLIKVNMHILIN